jgi:hypothetical protein
MHRVESLLHAIRDTPDFLHSVGQHFGAEERERWRACFSDQRVMGGDKR